MKTLLSILWLFFSILGARKFLYTTFTLFLAYKISTVLFVTLCVIVAAVLLFFYVPMLFICMVGEAIHVCRAAEANMPFEQLEEEMGRTIKELRDESLFGIR